MPVVAERSKSKLFLMMAAGKVKDMRKLVIIGDGNVGKTCLLGAFEGKQFNEDQYEPTIFHTTSKEMDHPTNPGEKVDLQL